MEAWIDFVTGPLFTITFTFMVIGLARHVLLQTIQLRRCIKRLANTDFAVGRNLKEIVHWLVPIGHVYRNRAFLSITSIVFHVGLLLVPLFLASHIELWHSALGLWWPGLPPMMADILTLVAIIGAVILFAYRLLDSGARHLSSPMDYGLLAVLIVPFASGFMAVHPAVNPLSYNTMLLIHVLSAELVFVLIPTTKLAHCVLFPFVRFSSDIFWKMPAGAGEKVARQLHGKDVCV